MECNSGGEDHYARGMAADLQQRIRWLALHGVIRGLSAVGARHGGDPQARLIADPDVR